MPSALVISDSLKLTAVIEETLQKDSVRAKILSWNSLKLRFTKSQNFSYLVLLVCKPTQRKVNRALALLEKTKAKVVISVPKISLDDKLLEEAKQNQAKIVCFDEVEEGYEIDPYGLAQEIVKNLYGFAGFKTILVGEKRKI